MTPEQRSLSRFIAVRVRQALDGQPVDPATLDAVLGAVHQGIADHNEIATRQRRYDTEAFAALAGVGA